MVVDYQIALFKWTFHVCKHYFKFYRYFKLYKSERWKEAVDLTLMISRKKYCALIGQCSSCRVTQRFEICKHSAICYKEWSFDASRGLTWHSTIFFQHNVAKSNCDWVVMLSIPTIFEPNFPLARFSGSPEIFPDSREISRFSGNISRSSRNSRFFYFEKFRFQYLILNCK